MKGWVDLGGWLYQNGLPKDGHHPSINRARHKSNYVDRDQRFTTKPGHHQLLMTDSRCRCSSEHWAPRCCRQTQPLHRAVLESECNYAAAGWADRGRPHLDCPPPAQTHLHSHVQCTRWHIHATHRVDERLQMSDLQSALQLGSM